MSDEKNTNEKTYVVTGFGAIVNCENNQSQLVMRNGPVPSNALPEHVEHLLNVGLIAEAEHFGGLEPVLTGDMQTVLTHPVGVDFGEPEADADGPDGPMPATYASKGAWVDYAVTQGADRAEAEAMSKNDLIDAYGPASQQGKTEHESV